MRQLFLALVMILSLSTLCFAQDEAQPVKPFAFDFGVVKIGACPGNNQNEP